VEDFLTENKVAERFTIEKKEVFFNKNNRQELE